MCRNSTDLLLVLLFAAAFPAAFSAFSSAMLWLAVIAVPLVLLLWLASMLQEASFRRRCRKVEAHRAKLWQIVEEENGEEVRDSLRPWR